MRALAVLGVVSFHSLTAPGTHPPYPGSVGIGARGVDVFFVLSGLCLSWPYTAESMCTARHMLTFFQRRLTRVVPTCWVAIGVFGLLALTPFGLPAMAAHAPTAQEQFADLIRDVLFVPTLQPYHDPVLWTLGFEMRWYLLFPVLLMIFFRSKTLFAFIALGAFAVNRLFALPDAGMLPSFMLGIAAAWIAKRADRVTPLAAVSALLAVIAAIADQCASTVVDHTDPIWQLASFAMVLAVATDPRLRRLFSLRALTGIGIASYSIYLIHLPIIASLARLGVSPVVAAAIGIGAGIAFWYVVERRLCSRAARPFMKRAFDPVSLVTTIRSGVERAI